MVARDGPAAQRCEADLAMTTRPGDAIAAPFGAAVEADAAPLGGCLAKQQSGAARRIDLHPVMHFQHLDIPIGVEPRRRLAHQMRKQRDAKRSIARLEHRDILCGIVDQIMVALLEPRRADDDGLPCGKAGIERRLQRAGRREIDEHIGGGNEPRDIAALVDAAAALPRLRNRGGERDAHPSLTADDADARHDASPYPIPLSASDRAKSRRGSPGTGRTDEKG